MNTPSKIPFQLVDDPWIPVLDASGDTRLISLRDAFRRGGEIRDLACGPAERISLIRLLVCIAQSSQATPQGDQSSEWEVFARQLESSALAYLDRPEVTAAFSLFGEGPRFLQFPSSGDAGMPTSKLFFHRATQGNPTHNDHGGGDERAFPDSELAVGLLTFQNFSPLLGRGYKGRGPCVEGNAAHVILTASTLKETIVANCLSLDAIAAGYGETGLGRPVWEMPPSPPFSPKAPATRNATHTYLGRLVPLVRHLWLADRTTVKIANGPEYPDVPAVREPSAIVVLNPTKNEHVLLPLRLGREVWRDLDGFMASGASPDGCLALRRYREKAHGIFVGGLVTDFKAKIENEVGSRFEGRTSIPDRFFADALGAECARFDYRFAMAAAAEWEKALWKALGLQLSKLKVDPKQQKAVRAKAQATFWSFAAAGVPDLFALFQSGEYPDLPLDHPYAPTAWHRSLRGAATRAYRCHAPRGNARQLEAFTIGLRSLYPKNPTPQPAR